MRKFLCATLLLAAASATMAQVGETVFVYNWSIPTPIAIPDANAAGISFDLVVNDNLALDPSNCVEVTLTFGPTANGHTWIGDLIATLTKVGDGTSPLFNRIGRTSGSTGFGDSSDARGPYTLTNKATADIWAAAAAAASTAPVPSGSYRATNSSTTTATAPPIDLCAPFLASGSVGTWRLTVSDNGGGDTGTLVSASLTLKGAPPPPTGACCLSDGSCVVTTQPACSGAYQGNGTTCTPTGACCVGGNTCRTGTIQACCANVGGVWQGVGSTRCQNCPPCPIPPCDYWETCAPQGPTSQSQHNFANNPIPAGFFGPGSQPFDGIVYLKGDPINAGQFGQTDTMVHRPSDLFLPSDPPSCFGGDLTHDGAVSLEDLSEFVDALLGLSFNACADANRDNVVDGEDIQSFVDCLRVGTKCAGSPDERTVPIEVTALNLVSVSPITVQMPAPESWDVRVGLSTVQPPPGSLRAIKTHSNGGTFDSTLPVQPRFIFTRVSNPSDVRILDTGEQGIPPIVLSGTDTPWVHTVAPNLHITHDPNSSWVAGVYEDVVTGVQSPVPQTEEEQLAEHCIGTPSCVVDLDIDSDNNNGVGLPDRSAYEDRIEMVSPGKFVCLNDDDDNGNDIPDMNESPVAGENDTVPIVMETDCKPQDPQAARWSLSWAPAAPIQIWATSNKTGAVTNGQKYQWPPPSPLWVEGIATGEVVLTFEIFLDGTNSSGKDEVKATVISVEITDENDTVLTGTVPATVAKVHQYKAKVTPAGLGGLTYQWTIDGSGTPTWPTAIKSYTHKITFHNGSRGEHTRNAIAAAHFQAQNIDFYWCKPVPGGGPKYELKLTVTAGVTTCEAKILVDAQHDADPNMNIYTATTYERPEYTDNQTVMYDHATWHLGNPPGPAFGVAYDTDFATPDYQGEKFLIWHRSIIEGVDNRNSYRAWRDTFNVPNAGSSEIKTTLGPALPSYYTLAGGNERSVAYGYVRLDEYGSYGTFGLEQIGDDSHPWHADGHANVSGDLPGIGGIQQNVGAADNMFWNWHWGRIDPLAVVAQAAVAAAATPAAVASTVPTNGATPTVTPPATLTEIKIVFDKPVSANGPEAAPPPPQDPESGKNLASTRAGKLKITKPGGAVVFATAVDASADNKTHTFTIDGVNTAGVYSVELTGTARGYLGAGNTHLFSFTIAN